MRHSTFDLHRILFTDSMTDGVLAKDAKDGGGYTAGFAGGSGAATMVGGSGN